MKISVRVKFYSGPTRVIRVDERSFEVKTNEKPIQGRANDAVIKALAQYLGVPRSRLEITKGKTSRDKVIQIF